MRTTKFSSNNNNNNKPIHRQWTPPLWLTGEKTPAKVRQFHVTLPAVDPRLASAIAADAARHRQPIAKEQKQLSILQSRLADQERKTAGLQAKLAHLTELKEQGVEDIRVAREQETQRALEEIEQSMRKEFEQATREAKERWRKEIEDECNEKRVRLRQEQEAQTEEEKAKAAETNDDGKEPGEETEERKVEPRKELQSEILKKELEEKKQVLDSLQEKRSEIVWLLKQVIKAEEKKKPVKSDKKPEAKTLTSKQA